MTREEIDALATRITELLARNAWVPGPVRPEPPGPPVPGHLPTWAGAAQQLSDVAPTPGRKTVSGRHRPSYDALTVAARAAAAGRGSSPLPGGDSPQGRSAATGRTLSIGVSNRHIHITQADFERLFGPGKHITPERPISQPGQFAAVERLKVTGPKGAIADVRIVGPARQTTQVELSATDCRTIGVDAPVRHSGRTSGSAGITLEGDAGTVQLPEGAIIAARHMHVATTDAPRLGVADGDRVAVVLGPADRRATLTDVLVRSGSGHATERSQRIRGENRRPRDPDRPGAEGPQRGRPERERPASATRHRARRGPHRGSRRNPLGRWAVPGDAAGPGPRSRVGRLARPAVTAGVSSIELRVRYAETDQMGVAHHANYLVWCEEARTAHFRRSGVSYRDLENQGLILVVVEVQVRYRAPARYDDLLRVDCWVRDRNRRRLIFGYAVRRPDDHQLLATAQTSLIALDSSHVLGRLPPRVLDHLEPVPDPIRL